MAIEETDNPDTRWMMAVLVSNFNCFKLILGANTVFHLSFFFFKLYLSLIHLFVCG